MDNEDYMQREILLSSIVEDSNDYIAMKSTNGWRKLEKLILDRTASLSKTLITSNVEAKMYRTQGEILGIQSLLNIVDTTIAEAEEAKKELEEIKNGTKD
jgi:hypothetical protein